MTVRLELRNPALVLALLHAIHDDPDPVPWAALVEAFAHGIYSRRTIENTLYDLAAYGAIQRIGNPAHGRQPDNRALRPTELGRAWLEQRIPPLPGDEP